MAWEPLPLPAYVPTLSMSAPTSPQGTANHSWIRAGATGSSPGHVALVAASKYLAAAAIDLLMQPALVGEIKEEFDLRTRNDGDAPDGSGRRPAAQLE